MKSNYPKVMHPVMGKSMLGWVMDVVTKAGATDITLVLSSDRTLFASLLESFPSLRVAVQKNQRGTGDAVASAALAFNGVKAPEWSSGELVAGAQTKAEWVLICAGDTPAMSADTIRQFIEETMASKQKLAVLGMRVPDPRGYGRLVKTDQGGLSRIVEERDADSETRKITLCNSGVILARVDLLFDLLAGITPANAQGEYYLTDIFSQAEGRGEAAFVFETDRAAEFAGVNDRVQLDMVERSMLRRRAEELMAQGVSIHLPDTVFIEADVEIEPDTRIYPGACLRGKTRIARNCVLGPHVVLEDAVLGAGVKVGAHSVLVRTSVPAGEVITSQAVMADVEL